MKKIALIGYGYWGPNLLRNLFDSQYCQVIYCLDQSPERLKLAKNRYPSLKITSDLNQILTDKSIDGLVIATPTSSHYQIAKQALLANKHVLIEKPMTINSKESQELVRLAAKFEKTLLVDHTFLFNDAVIKIKKIISKGELGDILYIDSVRANLGLFQPDINVIFDLAAHDFSIIQYILGSNPHKIRATGKSHYNKQEDIAYITAEYPNDILAHLHVSWLSPLKIRRMLIIGTKKMIVYDDTEPAEKVRVYDKGVILDLSSELEEQIKIGYRSGDAWLPKINFIEPLSLLIREFIKSMNNKKFQAKSNAIFSLKIVEILEAATQSIREKREVVL